MMTRKPDTRAADQWSTAFYVVVAVVALIGQTQAASRWLDWYWLPAAIAVATLELGGIALLARADVRRRIGERAIAARVLSAAIAGFAIVINFVGHLDNKGDPTIAGWFFAGMSALGYALWLIQSGDRRRDARRADRDMGTPPPEYGVWQWLRHPRVTYRARALHARTPEIGLYGSIDHAAAQLEAEARRRRLARLVQRRMRRSLGDRLAADIATASYDLDRVAELLAARADYDGLVVVLARDLAPDRVTAEALPSPVSPSTVDGEELYVPETWYADSSPVATLTAESDAQQDAGRDSRTTGTANHRTSGDGVDESLFARVSQHDGDSESRMALLWHLTGGRASGRELARAGGVSPATGIRRAARFRVNPPPDPRQQ
jgi:hypothetical protein